MCTSKVFTWARQDHPDESVGIDERPTAAKNLGSKAQVQACRSKRRLLPSHEFVSGDNMAFRGQHIEIAAPVGVEGSAPKILGIRGGLVSRNWTPYSCRSQTCP